MFSSSEVISCAFATIDEALEELRQGKMIVVVDDEDRENEGDLVMAAEKITPAVVNFMASYGKGLICVALPEEKVTQLQIPMMPVSDNYYGKFSTAFTVSVDASDEITTGISAFDRAKTIEILVAPDSQPQDLVYPGHIFPIQAKPGGVLERAGHTEAAVDLTKLAGLQPAGVICEIMNPDGTMARLAQLEVFAQEHDLKIIQIADLIRYFKSQ